MGGENEGATIPAHVAAHCRLRRLTLEEREREREREFD